MNREACARENRAEKGTVGRAVINDQHRAHESATLHHNHRNDLNIIRVRPGPWEPLIECFRDSMSEVFTHVEPASSCQALLPDGFSLATMVQS